MENSTRQLKPIGLLKSALFLLIPGIIVSINIYAVIPFLYDRGISLFISYNLLYFGMFTLPVIAALIGFLREGNPISWSSFKNRFWIKKLTSKDWLWLFLLIIMFLIVTIFVQYILSNFIVNPGNIPFFSYPRVMPSVFKNPVNVPTEFLEYPLKGQFWLIPFYLIFFFTNILGEQIWPRGYILPGQEVKFGKYAWLINGILNGLSYGLIWRPSIIFYILMFPLISFVIQRRKNLWIGIIFHYLLNLSFMIPMIRGIFS